MVIALVFGFGSAKAEFESKVNLIINNDIAEIVNKISFGAIENAIDSIDANLGEYEIPPFGPIKGIWAALNLDTITASGLWSYKDYRSVPKDKEYFYHRYNLIYGFGDGTKITIKWKNLPKNIDSAFITDIVTGTIINVDMMKNDSLLVTNRAIDKLFIKVWFNKNNVSVDENFGDNIIIYPNPASDRLRVNSTIDIENIEIYNTMGEKILTGNLNDINLSGLSSGVYTIKIITIDNKESYRRFVKL